MECRIDGVDVGKTGWIPAGEVCGEIFGYPVHLAARLGLRGWAYGVKQGDLIKPLSSWMHGYQSGFDQAVGISSEIFDMPGIGQIGWFESQPEITILKYLESVAGQSEESQPRTVRLLGGYLVVTETYKAVAEPRIDGQMLSVKSGYEHGLMLNLIATAPWSKMVKPNVKKHLIKSCGHPFCFEEGQLYLIPVQLPKMGEGKGITHSGMLTTMANGVLPILMGSEIRFQLCPGSTAEEMAFGNPKCLPWEGLTQGEVVVSLVDLHNFPFWYKMQAATARVIPYPKAA